MRSGAPFASDGPRQRDLTQTLWVRASAFDRMNGPAVVLDGNGVIIETNEAWRLFAQLNDGGPGASRPGLNYLDICDRAAGRDADIAKEAAAGLRQILRGERDRFDIEYPCDSPTEERWFSMQASFAPVVDGAGVVVCHHDITTRKLMSERLGADDDHDPLTGLPNRASAMRFLRRHLASTVPPDSIDMLRLRVGALGEIADRHGRHVADELMVKVASRARRVMPSTALLARFDDDEFVIICPSTIRRLGASSAVRCRRVLAAPFQIGSFQLFGKVSVGQASGSSDSSADELLAASAGDMRAEAVESHDSTLDDGLLGGTLAGPQTAAFGDGTDELAIFFQPDGTIINATPACQSLLGVAAVHLIGRNWMDLIHADDRDRVFNDLRTITGFGDHVRSEFRIADVAGSRHWIEQIAINVIDDPDVGCIVGHLREITEQKDAQERSDQSTALLSAIIDSSHVAIFSTSPSGVILSWNGGAAALFGRVAGATVGRHVTDVLTDHDGDELRDLFARSMRGESVDDFEVVSSRADGRDLRLSISVSPIRSGSGTIIGTSAIVSDTTERHLATAALEHRASHDWLTDLPNLAGLYTALEEAVGEPYASGNSGVAVAVVDLDHFALVNDLAGYAVGDKVLCAVADRLRAGFPATDVVGRTSGDEFTIVRVGVNDLDAAREIGRQAMELLQVPLSVDDRLVRVTASVGMAVSESEDSAESVLRDADDAMYQAKRDGRNRIVLLDHEARDRIHRRQAIAAALPEALAQSEFHLEYQPIVDMPTGHVAGFEALIRWNHPVLGVISPDEFISISERTGSIVSIGSWVLGEALEQLAAWRRDSTVPAGLWMAVNVSAEQLAHTEFVEEVGDLLRKLDLPASAVQLEITESVLMDRIDNAVGVIDELRAIGIRVSIDDFGTGYSSLSYLSRLPIDSIKIDRSFVAELNVAGHGASIVRAMLTLAQTLGLEVVAEGIEMAAQFDVLDELGCTFGQGYLWSPSLAPGAAIDWLHESDRPRPTES